MRGREGENSEAGKPCIASAEWCNLGPCPFMWVELALGYLSPQRTLCVGTSGGGKYVSSMEGTLQVTGKPLRFWPHMGRHMWREILDGRTQ